MAGALIFAIAVGFLAPAILTLSVRLLGLAILAVQVVAVVAGVVIGGLAWIGWFIVQPSAARAALRSARS
ncbi:MAG: hypothetical protein EON88_22935 [Brevundimonas sp.]|nr:MAG: hypothetical protein EON88_22935 [Brevundimonas sp.]